MSIKEIMKMILALVGNLGFLMYGMKLMSDGVQKSAGEKLQRTLAKMTGNRFTGLLTGMVITMIIQSSGATTAMVVTFVNAGLLTLTQSVGVIFGANIGTTITAWIVSIFGFNFKISVFAVPILGFGYFLSIIRKGRYKGIAEAVMGFALLFIGLSGLSDLFTDPAKFTWFAPIQEWGIGSVLLGFVIGIFFTGLLHSSSAFSAIVIALAYNKIVNWEFAAALTLGSNIGSTIDAVLAAVGKSADAKRSALIHVLFNVFGTIIALCFFKPFLRLVTICTPGGEGGNIAIRISMMHTVFKALSACIFLPLVKPLVKLSEIIIKNKVDETPNRYVLEFQEHAGKESITAFIMTAEKAVADMTDVVTGMFDRIQIGVTKRNKDFIEKHLEPLNKAEDYCDQMHEQIVKYLVQCERLSVTSKQTNNLSLMTQIVDELENMSDNCYTTSILLAKSVDKKMKFQQEDMEQLIPYVELARQFLQFIRININKHLDENKLAMATELEESIDKWRKDLKKIARKRLESGADVKAELLFLDIIRQIEKIGDNCFSISELLTQTQ
ncbi:MAG: Na/Pi cotransporter family protein [Treponema sp.]|nr:Na/Pi cotransporter family protein [Treponema sp.]